MNALTSLKDIPGVFGSFVFSPEGTLAARDMPAVYPDSLFDDICRRLQSIAEAVEPALTGFYELLAKFDGHWLLTRMTPKGTLNILADESVNFPALKMAANVAVKHLDELTMEKSEPAAAVSSVVPESVAEPVALAPAPAAPAPLTNKPKRMWRGMVMD